MYWIACIFCCLWIVSCSRVQPIPSEKLSPIQVALLDSLKKYPDADSLSLKNKNAFTLFVGKCNGVRFGIIAYYSGLVYYDKKHNRWHTVEFKDSLFFFGYNHRVRYEDVNGDNYRDILIHYYLGASGWTMNNVLLFDPNAHTFKHNSSYDLPNIQYIASNHSVISYRYYDMVHCSSFARYKITADSLIKAWEAKYCPINEHRTNDSASIELWERDRENRMVYHQTIGKRETIDQLYKLYSDSLDRNLK